MIRRRATLLVMAALLGGCMTVPPFPAVDLSSPGWQVKTGQAIWRPDRDKPEIVGDLIVATGQADAAYVQFSKALPIASGQVRSNAWEIEFPPQNKRYAAPGEPPARIVWLQLLRVLAGEEAAGAWQVERPSADEITMESRKSGERLEVHF